MSTVRHYPPPGPLPRNLEGLIEELRPRWGWPLYITSQAATAIGVATGTVVRWRQQQLLTPKYTHIRGKQEIPVYTLDDIHRGMELKGSIPPGPKSTKHLSEGDN